MVDYVKCTFVKLKKRTVSLGKLIMGRRRSNPVAKNMNKFNKPATHKDRKREAKRRSARKNVCVWDLEKEG